MNITPAMLRALAEGRNPADATPDSIMRSEREGQTALVSSTNVPIEMRPSRDAFEKIGFVFGDKVDELFIIATLPAGWSRAATDHSMHSDILDQHGRKRISVFYKAAFYDRRADCYLTRRYKTENIYGDLPGGEGLAADEAVVVVTDAGKEIHRTPATRSSDYPAQEAARKDAQAWLKERFPDADDATAYWDAP